MLIKLEGLPFYADFNRKYKISKRKVWEPVTTSVFKEFIKSSRGFVDVGANFGYFSVLASKLSNAQVFAFEPDSDNFKLLQRNIEMNKCQKIEAFQLAVSNKKDKVYLYKHPNTMKHSLVPYWKRAGKLKQQVSGVTLDSFLSDHEIDLIKIDVEGSETRVMQGMSSIIAQYKPRLIFEFCPKFLKHAGGTSYIREIAQEYQFIYAILDRKSQIREIKPDELCEKTYSKTKYSKENIVFTDRRLDISVL